MPGNREIRIQTSLLAPLEKRCLIWMAERLPAAIHSDHLTAIGAVAMLLTGVCYAVAAAWPLMLPVAVFFLAVNWFGDSLDGTIARVRHHERPRYGFYVDHVLDALGMLFIVGGLVSGHLMTPPIGAALLIAYYLLTIEIALATHTVGTFRISYWLMGPTELRILLAIGTLRLLQSHYITVLGATWLLFDVGGVIAAAALAATFCVSAISNGRRLYRAEPLPSRRPSRVGANGGSGETLMGSADSVVSNL